MAFRGAAPHIQRPVPPLLHGQATWQVWPLNSPQSQWGERLGHMGTARTTDEAPREGGPQMATRSVSGGAWTSSSRVPFQGTWSCRRGRTTRGVAQPWPVAPSSLSLLGRGGGPRTPLGGRHASSPVLQPCGDSPSRQPAVTGHAALCDQSLLVYRAEIRCPWWLPAPPFHGSPSRRITSPGPPPNDRGCQAPRVLFCPRRQLCNRQWVWSAGPPPSAFPSWLQGPARAPWASPAVGIFPEPPSLPPHPHPWGPLWPLACR